MNSRRTAVMLLVTVAALAIFTVASVGSSDDSSAEPSVRPVGMDLAHFDIMPIIPMPGIPEHEPDETEPAPEPAFGSMMLHTGIIEEFMKVPPVPDNEGVPPEEPEFLPIGIVIHEVTAPLLEAEMDYRAMLGLSISESLRGKLITVREEDDEDDMDEQDIMMVEETEDEETAAVPIHLTDFYIEEIPIQDFPLTVPYSAGDAVGPIF